MDFKTRNSLKKSYIVKNICQYGPWWWWCVTILRLELNLDLKMWLMLIVVAHLVNMQDNPKKPHTVWVSSEMDSVRGVYMSLSSPKVEN